MNIISGPNLNNLTTFRIGGKARFFCAVNSIEDIEKALDYASNNNLKIFILGGGSNILFSDQGFDGLVIKMEMKGVNIEDVDSEKTFVEAYAGEVWDDFVNFVVDKGLYGLENLSYIPGTVGASPVQNIGAYGSEVKDTIYSLKAFDIKEKKIVLFNNKDCDFSYRNSLFKKEKDRYIIISVKFILNKNGKLNLEYKDIKEYLLKNNIKNPSLLDTRKAVIDIRRNKLPDISIVGTAGSFFKNPIIKKDKANELKNKWLELPVYEYNESEVKVSLAWIIDKICGLKGISKGDVGTYKNQALVIVNNGNATAKQVKDFANEIIKSVKDKTDIDIETEVEWV